MTDNRSIVPQGRRDVAPTRSPSRSVVQHQARVPDVVRQPPAREARREVIPAPDLNWRTVPREERRHTGMAPVSRREAVTSPREDERHQIPDAWNYEEHYPDAYDYDRPVHVRHQVRDDGRSVNVHVHIENRNDAARSSDLEGLWVGGSVVAFAAFVALILAILVHH